MLAHRQTAPQPGACTIDADGAVEGYASRFGVVDSARHMMMPGSFARFLARRGAAHRIPLLFQHDPSEPIGVWFDLKEDARGLRVRGRLIPACSARAKCWHW